MMMATPIADHLGVTMILPFLERQAHTNGKLSKQKVPSQTLAGFFTRVGALEEAGAEARVAF
jgi:hypothetical protein